LSKKKSINEIVDESHHFEVYFTNESHDINALWIISLLVGGALFAGSFAIFKDEGCPINQYLEGGNCISCMGPLVNCAVCTEFNKCDECEERHFMTEVEVLYSG